MGKMSESQLTRRWSCRILVAFCGWTMMACPVQSQPLPQPPRDSDIAFRLLPSALRSQEMDSQILAEQPLVRVAGTFGMKYLGFDPIFDLDRSFEGTVVGAILSSPKGVSSMGTFIQDRNLREQRSSAVEELRSLASDLESYYQEMETYPEDFADYLENHRYYEPYFPAGVDYRYERLDGGKDFRLVMSYAPESRLRELGPPPTLKSQGNWTNRQPSKPPVPLNFVIGAKVADASAARDLVSKLMGEPDRGFWTNNDDLHIVATLRGSWLVVADDKKNLGLLLRSLSGEGAGLSKNVNFGLVARNIDTESAGMLYVDFPRILGAFAKPSSESERKLMGLAGPAGYALIPYQKSQMRLESFVGLRAPKGSRLQKFLTSSDAPSADVAMVADNIPWDVSNVLAVDYREVKELVDAAVDLFPEARQAVDLVEDMSAGFLGLDASRGFDDLVSGWAILSFERIDIFVNAWESVMEKIDRNAAEQAEDIDVDFTGIGGPDADAEPVFPEGEIDLVTPADGEEDIEIVIGEMPGPDSNSGTDDGDSDVNVDVEVETGPPVPPRLPFTVALMVPDGDARATLIKNLAKFMGDDPQILDMFGVTVTDRSDQLLAYAVNNDWLYVSGGGTQRLMRNLLAAATGHKKRLTSLDSWSRFRLEQKGRPLAFGHQKVDAVYSVVKGFLLFLGADFRPMAEELGQLRDYHGAVLAVPDGLLMVGEVLRGDE